MQNKTFTDGIHSISNEEYHASNGISRSQLMLLDKSPYHFWYEVMSGEAEKRQPTPAMNIGSAFHTRLLEPELFDKEYAVMPAVDRRTKQGKEDYQAFVDESEHKIVLTLDQFAKVNQMAKLVKRHEIVTTLLDEAVFEQSIFWTDPETGLQFKTRPDIWSSKMIVDVKTTADASEYQMKRAALDYGYYLQAGMAYEACKAIGQPFDMFVIMACEKTEPYVPAVFMMNDDALQFGIDQFMKYKIELAECINKNKWPGYPVQELTVPQYAINNLNNEE